MHIPLSGPVHKIVRKKHGWKPVEDLALCPTKSVKHSVVTGTGEGVLAIRRYTVLDNALLLGTTWFKCQPMFPPISTSVTDLVVIGCREIV